MEVSITARHCEISDTLRRRAEARLGRLTRYDPRLNAADAVFTTEHGEHRVELRLKVAREPVIVAHGRGASFPAAFDRAHERAGRQLKRRRELRHDRPAVRLTDLEAATPGPG